MELLRLIDIITSMLAGLGGLIFFFFDQTVVSCVVFFFFFNKESDGEKEGERKTGGKRKKFEFFFLCFPRRKSLGKSFSGCYFPFLENSFNFELMVLHEI